MAGIQWLSTPESSRIFQVPAEAPPRPILKSLITTGTVVSAVSLDDLWSLLIAYCS